MKKSPFMALVLVMLLTLLVGCTTTTPTTTTSAPPTTAPQTPATEPPSTVRTSIKTAIAAEMNTLDPYNTNTGTLSNLIYNGLIRKTIVENPDGSTGSTYIPCLATSWEVSDDGLAYTFNIRKGVKFHNGDELTARDVAYSFRKTEGSAFATAFLSKFDHAELVDDWTVILYVKEVDVFFIDGIPSIFIINEKWAEEVGSDIANQAMGTGPYILEEYLPMQSYTLSAFRDYWEGGEKLIPTLILDIIADQTTRTLALEAGQLDFLALPANAIDRVEATGLFNILYTEGRNCIAVAVNHEKAPFDNLLIRKAIAHAVNRENNVMLARGGYGIEAVGFFHPTLIMNSSLPGNPNLYDLALAKQYMAEAGFPDGAGFPEITMQGSAGLVQDSLEVLQQDLAAIGIKTKIEILEGNTLGVALASGDYEMTIVGANISDIIQRWWYFFTTEALDLTNYGRYSDPYFDSLFTKLSVTYDDAEQRAINNEIINIINDEVIYIPISFGVNATALAKDLAFDVHPSALRLQDLYYK